MNYRSDLEYVRSTAKDRLPLSLDGQFKGIADVLLRASKELDELDKLDAETRVAEETPLSEFEAAMKVRNGASQFTAAAS